MDIKRLIYMPRLVDKRPNSSIKIKFDWNIRNLKVESIISISQYRAQAQSNKSYKFNLSREWEWLATNWGIFDD